MRACRHGRIPPGHKARLAGGGDELTITFALRKIYDDRRKKLDYYGHCHGSPTLFSRAFSLLGHSSTPGRLRADDMSFMTWAIDLNSSSRRRYIHADDFYFMRVLVVGFTNIGTMIAIRR